MVAVVGVLIDGIRRGLGLQCSVIRQGRTGDDQPLLGSRAFALALLLDSWVVELTKAYNLIFSIISSLKSLFFNSFKNELGFSGHIKA